MPSRLFNIFTILTLPCFQLYSQPICCSLVRRLPLFLYTRHTPTTFNASVSFSFSRLHTTLGSTTKINSFFRISPCQNLAIASNCRPKPIAGKNAKSYGWSFLLIQNQEDKIFCYLRHDSCSKLNVNYIGENKSIVSSRSDHWNSHLTPNVNMSRS